ncbi:MAG TPA: GNAT family N-acetyltransferase [Nakamurella sp.]
MVDWAGTVVATTRRLVLRTFRADDLPRYAALNADPLVVRHLGGRPFGREYSDGIAEWAQESFARQGFGLLAVERRSDGAFLGMCGLHRHSSHQEEVEVAWRFASQYWGNGYATEAATGWMDHGFHDLALDHVISMTDEPNRPSQAVMHRLGMVYDRDIEIVEDGERITRWCTSSPPTTGAPVASASTGAPPRSAIQEPNNRPQPGHRRRRSSRARR